MVEEEAVAGDDGSSSDSDSESEDVVDEKSGEQNAGESEGEAEEEQRMAALQDTMESQKLQIDELQEQVACFCLSIALLRVLTSVLFARAAKGGT